ncbi:MAG: oligosaccharide flippase family protein [Alphaproteobacteria bacterium]
MSSARVARGGALGLATVVAERALSLAGIVALGRILAPADFGRWAFVVSWLAVFQVLADPGLEAVLVRRLSEPGADRARLLGSALSLRALLALASAAIAVALAPLAVDGPSGAGTRLLVACGAAALLLQAQPGFRSLLRAELRIGTVFAVAAATGTAALLATVVAALAGLEPNGIFLAAAAAQACGLAAAWFAARRSGRLDLRVDPSSWKGLLREAWPVGANVLVVTLGLRMGALALMRARGPDEVGFYSSATRLTESLNLLADGAMLTVFPVLARRAFEGASGLLAIARPTARLLAIAVLAAILVIVPLAPDLMGRLFRPEFAAAAPAMVIASFSALLAALGTLYGGVLVATGRQRVLLWINAAATVLLVGLQWVVVPRAGMVGAASVSLAVSAASHLVLASLPATRDLVGPCLRAAAGPVACALLLLAFERVLPGAPLARAAILSAAFPVLLWASGALDRCEIEALGAALGGERSDPCDRGSGGSAGGSKL